ncbi:MAG TPA: hypothetical protein VKA31_11355 [Mariprofundaceae bacterium]|nr:hypothetical protein [Mariprofundaceae bacterium]
MPVKTKAPQQTVDPITNFFAGKPIPGGPEATSFQRVLSVLQQVLGQQALQKKKKKQTKADKLYGG